MLVFVVQFLLLASAVIIRAGTWLGAPGVDLAEALIPLVDVRSHVIARRDRFGLIIDWYGELLVVNGK